MTRPLDTDKEAAASGRGAESGSLAKGLQVLDALREALMPLAHSEVAETCGLAPSTAHRVLQMLIDARQVERTPGGRYRPAARSLLPLGLDHPMNLLRRDSIDLLRGLRDRHGPTTSLILYFGRDRSILDTALGRYSVLPYYDTHVASPLHTTVSGKLLLAHMTQPQRDSLLSAQPLTARTDRSIVDRTTLEQELVQAKAEGFATNLHENVAGICACGSVLRSPAGAAIGALVMSGPSQYFAEKELQAMKRDMLEAASVLNNTSSALRAFARFLE